MASEPARGRAGLLLALAAASVILASYILWVEGPSKTLGISDYISDEIWYVSSAVNVARKVLGLHIVPRVNATTAVYTVFYDNTSCGFDQAWIEVLNATAGEAVLARTGYGKIAAFAVYVPLNVSGEVEGLPERSTCIVDVMPGVAPDEKDINSYLNTEHPPLVKYVIALALYLGGWQPRNWRLPSYAMGVLALASVAATAYLVSRRFYHGSRAAAATGLLLVAAAAPLVAWRDASIQAMSSVAMLDIYVAAFDAAAVAALLSGRVLAAGALLGLAGASKYTGLFPLPMLLLPPVERRRGVAASLLALAIVAASWLPFMLVYGPGWVVEQVAWAASWHTTSRPPGPPSTTPLGLLLGRNGFVLYYVNDKPLLVAACNPGLCLSGMAAGLAIALAALGRCLRGRGAPEVLPAASAPLLSWLGYAAVYAAGNHTLYSFYSVQLAALNGEALSLVPLAAGELGYARPRLLHRCITSPEMAGLRAAAAAAAGYLLGLAASHGAPVDPMRPMEWAPLYAAMAWDKVTRLLVAAAGLAVYTVTAYSLRGAAKRWLAAGLASYTGPMAPVAAVLATALREGGAPRWLLAGLLAPPAALAPLAAVEGAAAAAALAAGWGLAAAAAVASTGAGATGLWLPWSLAALIAALAAAAGLERRWGLYASALAEPGLLALLALEGGPEAPIATVIAALGLYLGAPWLYLAAVGSGLLLAAAELLAARRGSP